MKQTAENPSVHTMTLVGETDDHMVEFEYKLSRLTVTREWWNLLGQPERLTVSVEVE